MKSEDLKLEINKHLDKIKSIFQKASEKYVRLHTPKFINEQCVDFGGSCGYSYLVSNQGRHPIIRAMKKMGLIEKNSKKKPYYIYIEYYPLFSQCYDYNLYINENIRNYLNKNLGDIFYVISRFD